MNRNANRLIWTGGILSFLNLAFFLLMRSIWIFINAKLEFPKSVPITLSTLLVGIMGFMFLYFLGLSAIRTYTDRFKNAAPPLWSVIVSFLLEFAFLGLNIYLYIQMGYSQGEVPRRIISSLPVSAIFAAALFLVLIYPKIEIVKSRVFKLLVVFATVLAALFLIVRPLPVKITAGPVLQQVDEDTVAVVWSTNFNSTGEVLYGPDTGHMNVARDMEDGLIEADTKLHRVLIPLKASDKMVYQVSSTKINRLYECNAEYGNTAMSPVAAYKSLRVGDETTFCVLNDVHDNTRIYMDFLSGKRYDFVVVNGDALTSAESPAVINSHLLNPIGEATNGGIPYYFTRGNHETRGAEARNLKNYMALPGNRYYYTFKAGPVFAIVLDSGEDKPDEDKEYSGLVDFKSYRTGETEWLAGVLASDAYKSARYRVAFIHAPLNSYIDEEEPSILREYESAWRRMLSDAGIDVAFSGHTHKAQLLKPEDYSAAFPTVIGGGEASDEKDFVVTKAEVNQDRMVISYVGKDGRPEEVLRLTPRK